MQGIVDEYWLDETDAVVAVTELFRVHLSRSHPDRDTENQYVCHPLT
jgi:hypothetical protein